MATNFKEDSSIARVSVVIPTYNRAGFIVETIRSVLAQTFDDFEVIVVDDGSTDNTREVVESFKNHRILYIYQTNAGVSAARNTGIKASSGTYIAFVDSDDVLLENALELSVTVLEKSQQVAFSYGKAYLMDDKQHIFGSRQQREKGSYIREGREEIKKAIIKGNHIPTSTIVVRRKHLEEVGHFNTFFKNGSEDFDLWVRLATSHAVAYIAKPLIIYRVHASSISRTHKLAEIEKNNGIIFERIFNDPQLSAHFSIERPNTYLHMYLRLAKYACGNREMATSRKYLLQALQTRPIWFLKRLWLPLIFRFCLTLVPPMILDSGHKTKRFLKVTLRKSISRLKHKS